MAATELRPRVCAAVVIPTVVVYLTAAIATQDANAEPWASITLGTCVLAGVGAGCIGLSAIQRSRVMTISSLARDRTHLLAELISLERRERQVLAEHLHDGALQYVLAARQDLDEIALGGLVRRAAAQGRRAVLLDVHHWPEQGTSADALLFGAARELLSNVVKHSHATSVDVALGLWGPFTRLVVADNGRGLPTDAAPRGPADGHIGLASHALRIEAAGGRLTLRPGRPTGTVVTVELPYRPFPAGALPD